MDGEGSIRVECGGQRIEIACRDQTKSVAFTIVDRLRPIEGCILLEDCGAKSVVLGGNEVGLWLD